MKSLVTWLILLLSLSVFSFVIDARPNIILLLTDDQDFYDLGYHGNPDIDTPNLDQFAAGSLEMRRFYVSPLCSPTRASLLTGRYHQRTGILHTSRGATRLADDEVTIAEVLRGAGYRTGIFGKWHLGDNYPSRPQDQGFEETFYHKSGGIGQPPDEDGTYWQPVMHHNGQREVHERYCTDLFFDAAIDYMLRSDDRPFFIYLPTNVPHTPLDIDEHYYKPFMKKGVEENTARVFGMLKNLDENFGRLMKELQTSGKSNNTLVIFMSDNGGTRRVGFQGDFRGHKGDIFEGGIRAPFFVRWPDRVKQNHALDVIGGHIDLLPTLAEVAGIDLPMGLHVDGKSLLPLWLGKSSDYLKLRIFFMHFNKSIEQALYKCATAISQRYKLILNPDAAFDSQFVPDRDDIQLELYNINEDPGETNNLADDQPGTVEILLEQYEKWHASVKSSRNMKPGRIHIDPTKENPVHLSRYQEGYHWHHDSIPEGWMLKIRNTGRYRLHFTNSNKYPFSLDKFWEKHLEANAIVKWKGDTRKIPLEHGVEFVDVSLAEGEGRLDVYFEVFEDGKLGKNWNSDISIESR